MCSNWAPRETRRAKWIPCENHEGKSLDLPWMFPFLLQLSDRRQKIFFIFPYILKVMYFTNTILTIIYQEADKHK